MTNPFMTMNNPQAWGPGSFEMAYTLMTELNIRNGMRVLEIGGGSGQIAAATAKHWGVTVVTLEPWTDGTKIMENAAIEQASNLVLPLRVKAQNMPLPSNSFDAVFSIGSFEMIGDERPQALNEMIRVARPGSLIGIAEPMCYPVPMPQELREIDQQEKLEFEKCFQTIPHYISMFEAHGLTITNHSYFEHSRLWWEQYRDMNKISEAEQRLITLDEGQWLALGMIVGRKPEQI